jgi:hypothetical protein
VSADLRFNEGEELLNVRGPFSMNVTTFSCASSNSHSIASLEDSKAQLVVLCSMSFTANAADSMLPMIWAYLGLAHTEAPITPRNICSHLVTS